jgi:ABC-2 type transport system permease protein
MRLLRAEVRKLFGLPSAWAALALCLVVAPAISYLNRRLPSPDAGYQELVFGVVGAIVLGVVAVSSEYRAESAEDAAARQIVTSLTAVPSRVRLLAAKAGALILTMTVAAAVTAPATLTIRGGTLAVSRMLGVVVYFVLTALLAFGVTLVTRSGIVPLTMLIVNATVVSVSFLISRALPVANYLPDLAGARMFIRHGEFNLPVAPVTGGLVMAGWTILVVAAGAAAFCRRDAG